MKRIILLALCISIYTYSFADTVNRKQAAKTAESLFSGGVQTKSAESSLNLVWTWPEVQTKAGAGNEPLLYVFERNGGGFAIVAGEDAAHPILGYSETGSFPVSDMPDNMRGWLEWYGEVLQCARDNHLTASPEIREEWYRRTTLADLENEQSAQLETARWHQGRPYNDFCPVIDGKRSQTGCLATAIAIIMRYHQWPRQGSGDLPSYDYNYNGVTMHIEGHRLGHEYQWEKMPLDPPYDRPNGYTEEESKQVAQLLYDVGVMAQMRYTPTLSGAGELTVLKLTEFFDYDKDIHTLIRTNGMPSDIWHQLIRSEIEELRPVLYTATSSFNESHAMVIDGYKGEYFSINFGWGHDATLFLLTPIPGQDDRLPAFYQRQHIFYKIQPNKEGVFQPNEYTLTFSNSFTRCDWDFRRESFSYYTKLSRIGDQNLSLDYDIECCLGHFDKNDHLVEVVSDTLTISSGRQHIIDFQDCHFGNPIKDGDNLKPYYRIVGQSEWRLPYIESEAKYLFDRHTPLSESIEFGFSFDPFDGETFTSLAGQGPSVFVLRKKNVAVHLLCEDGSGLFVPTSAESFVIYGPSITFCSQSVYEEESQNWLTRFWLPPKAEDMHNLKYKIVIRDLDDEMTIHFNL